jgi:prevent-host-death family protein
MRFVGVREAQVHLSGLVDRAQKERVILTRHGRPIAILTGVEGRDLEELLLSQDPGFGRTIAARRTYRGPLVSHETLRAETEAELQRSRKRAPVKKRGNPKRRTRTTTGRRG